MIPFNCLTFSILCMVVGAPVAWVIGRRNGYYAGIFAFLVMIASFVGFAVAWFDMAYLDPSLTHWEALPWFDPNIVLNPSTPRPWVFGLLLDNLSLPIAAIVLILTTAATCYSIGYMREEHGRGKYFALLLLYNAGILGVVLATNLLEFYLFWELMLIPSYFLIAQWGSKPKSVTIAFKYFIFTHVGAVCIILAIAGVWTLSAFPTLNMASAISTEVINLTGAMANPALLNLVKLLVVLFLLGFSVKMAIVPIHTWLPDAHAEAPTPISVILSGVMIETAAYAIVRILMTFTFDAFLSFAPILSVFGVITMIYGGIMALAQKDTKRLFAYSSISQMGYIFFGLSTMIPAGVTGATFHIFTHALGKGLLFMTAGALIVQVGHDHGRDINAMGGLARTMPWTATVALIAALSIAGTPPLAGFASEWIIFAGGAITGNFFIVLFAVASTALTASYVLWFIRRVFFGPTPPEMEKINDTPWTMRGPMLALAVLAIVIGVWPALVVNPIYQAIAAIFGI
jgi:NADH-quinone oxidoreductase subunit M